MNFYKDILKIDCEGEVNRICSFIQQQVASMRRDGIVVGLSGGVDSALAAALCVKALGMEKVYGLILPEKESNPVSAEYAKKHAEQLGITTETIDITHILEEFGTYDKRDKIIREIFPEYDNSYKLKITLPADLLSKDAFNFFTLKIENDNGNEKSARLKKDALNGIVAATDTKQRTRMMHLYYYAEMKNYLVCGTTNKSEVMQGFFVKYGDGGVDIEPLAHLYKTQVYQLSEHLDVIKEIIDRAPSPDTFSFQVSDEEFYFRIPYDKLDLLLYAWENKSVVSEVCEIMDLKKEQVKRAFRDFSSKYNATKHLRELPPMLNQQ
ncbi:NAD+ synthetase [Thermoplasmatales archaeon SCGC AB-540-F20]|nr:NAD+ synthetase [Thermoplasmatales archaeon SCGC AB-540-F20]